MTGSALEGAEETFHATQNWGSLLLSHKDPRGPYGPRGLVGGPLCACPSG